ncbi:MAG: hypothetical protein SPL80_02095 [Bacilli bacterium]|nr:hypothetical protein [Bacilli bacterium]
MKNIARYILGCAIFQTVALMSVVALSLSWFTQSDDDDKRHAIDGEIGLRGYYYAGDGSVENPFEIVKPEHFYNLTRLQNLGIYKTKKYFQIGHDFGDGVLKCLDGGEMVDYLDMSKLQRGKTIRPIGNEATPFVGTFDGSGIPVRNLEVTGYPEDIGVFGYVDFQGRVENLLLDNVTINSLGYTTTQSRDDYTLFSADIDHIFASSASNLAKQSELYLYKKENGDWGNKIELKNASTHNVSGLNTVPSDNVFEDAYFVAKFPTDPTFTYSVVLSSTLLAENGSLPTPLPVKADTVHNTSNPPSTSDAVFMNIKPLKDSVTFNAGDKDYETESRISIVASTKVDDYTFSRVIQSYTITFHSNGDNNDATTDLYSAAIHLDYSAGAMTNYHHGNNIGFIAGHVNGTVTNSYVNGSKMVFNQTGYTPIYTESDTGLIGEIGKNVINSIDPELGLNPKGDTGVINFTRIYKLIRGDATATHSSGYAWRRMETQPAHWYKQPKFYYRWHTATPDPNKREPYLRDTKLQDTDVNGSWAPFTVPVLGEKFFYIKYSSEIGESAKITDYQINNPPNAGEVWELQSAANSPMHYRGVNWKRSSGNNTFKIGRGDPEDQYLNSYAYYLDYDADVFYERVAVDAEPPVFAGRHLQSDNVTSVDYISYDRFKKDGIECGVEVDYPNQPTLPWLCNSFAIAPTSGQLYMFTPGDGDPILYSFLGGATSSSDNWQNENAIVDNGNPKETNVVEVNHSSRVDTNYYYIDRSDNTLYYHDLDDDTFSLYRKYLRKDVFAVSETQTKYPYITGSSGVNMSAGSHSITSDEVGKKKFDSVDFLWNQLIEDDTTKRGMGVFKIATAYSQAAAENVSDMTTYARYAYDKLNQCKIVNGNDKTKVYFSTAEYDFKKSGTTSPSNYTWATDAPLRATTLPSYFEINPDDEERFDINSFNYPFSRDYNYCFEMDLSAMEGKAEEDIHYYFNNPVYEENSTATSFLGAYLHTVLRDKDNHHLKPGDDKFGFGFIRADIENDAIENLTSLSSYMPVSCPYNQTKISYNGRYYPPKTIAFSIDNESGANVAVVGKGNDITVYSNDVNSENKNTIKPLYAMRSSNANQNDQHRYFEYNYDTNVIEKQIKNNEGDMKDTEELYAHIFNLPAGDYVIGSNSGTADIYYLSVQGQTEGEIGNKGVINVGTSIENVDFLTSSPTFAAFQEDSTLALIRAYTSFSANINTASGTVLYVDNKSYGATRYVWFKFMEQQSTQSITSFITYSEYSWYHFYQNNAVPTRGIRIMYRPTS